MIAMRHCKLYGGNECSQYYEGKVVKSAVAIVSQQPDWYGHNRYRQYKNGPNGGLDSDAFHHFPYKEVLFMVYASNISCCGIAV